VKIIIDIVHKHRLKTLFLVLVGVLVVSFVIVKEQYSINFSKPTAYFTSIYENIRQKWFSENDLVPLYTKSVLATAYASVVAQTDSTPCLTYTDFDVCSYYNTYGKFDTIASNGIRLGAIVKIPELFGDKLFVVRDRMNERYGDEIIDIWLPNNEHAKVFGAKRVTIEVYGN
jgi:3D (Asp-Asp-Asp) domain-containing protein